MFEVYFDGACPLCLREVQLLRRLDRHDRILFTDIAAPGFDPRSTGHSMEELMRTIRGRMADGTAVEGVEVFRQLYGAVGFAPLVAVSRLPGLRQALDLAYDGFARNRLRLTGRCHDGACALPVAA